MSSDSDIAAQRQLSELAELSLQMAHRLEAAMDYLDQYALDALPEDAKHLLWLLYSLVNVSFPAEVWRQPQVPDSGAARIDQIVEPAV